MKTCVVVATETRRRADHPRIVWAFGGPWLDGDAGAKTDFFDPGDGGKRCSLAPPGCLFSNLGDKKIWPPPPVSPLTSTPDVYLRVCWVFSETTSEQRCTSPISAFPPARRSPESPLLARLLVVISAAPLLARTAPSDVLPADTINHRGVSGEKTRSDCDESTRGNKRAFSLAEGGGWQRRSEIDSDHLLVWKTQKTETIKETCGVSWRDLFSFPVCGGADSFEETGTVEDAECKHPEAC